MEIYPVTSVLQGPSVPVNKKIKLHRLFEKNEKNYEDHLAVIYEEMGQPSVRLSCSELNAIANQLARGIVARAGAANSDADFVVAVQLPPSDGLLAVLLAIWKSGGTYLPVDPTAPEHRISHVLDEAKPCLVITHSPDEVFEKISDNVFSLKQLKKFSATFSTSNLEDEETLNGDRSEKTAIIIYTSGSTGTPKGVRLPHYVIYNRLNWQWNRFPFSETEKACVFKTSLTFVDAVAEIWAPLLHDSPRCLIVVPKSVTKDPERLINILDQHKIERLVLVPSLLHAILLYLGISNNNNQFSSMENQNNEQGILSRLKLWICSGEPLPVSLAKQFLDTFSGHTLCNFYGSTEIMADATYYAINSYKDLCYGDKIPIGVPIDNTELYLLDSQGHIVTPGSLGELFVAGANLASGYVNNRDPHRFIKNKFSQNKGMDKMYQTGDFGKIVNGVLLYEGRTDSQIKVRGHRVDLMEVESAIHKLPNSDIDKLAVLCYKPGETEQALLAFVVFNKDKNVPSTMQIEEKLRHALPDYALPQVISLDTMPYLINGKIDRQSLLRMYSNMSSTNKVNKLTIDYSGVSSTKMSTAKSLFETLSDVLGNSLRSHITSNANFFALGGNSLNAIYTISKLADLGYSINVSDFIIAPDLGTIVKKMVFTGKPEELSCCSENWLQEKYLVQILEPKHKNDVIRIIADSFYEKADLEHWLEPAVPYSDYTDILEMIWEPLVEKKLSFAVYSKESNQMVGASLNFDMLDEPDIDFNGRLLLIFEFLEFLEGPLRDNRLPKGKGRIIHSFMMGTDKLLDAATNVEIITYMEQENLKIGKAREFDGIFTTNTNPLTQQLGTNVFGYKTLLDYQVNKYVTSDGIQLFRKAPDTQRAICCWKLII